MAQNVLFEEDGAFRAGTVLSGSDSALQVELASGKRVKVKAAHVLLRYESPAPAELQADTATSASATSPRRNPRVRFIPYAPMLRGQFSTPHDQPRGARDMVR